MIKFCEDCCNEPQGSIKAGHYLLLDPAQGRYHTMRSDIIFNIGTLLLLEILIQAQNYTFKTIHAKIHVKNQMFTGMKNVSHKICRM